MKSKLTILFLMMGMVTASSLAADLQTAGQMPGQPSAPSVTLGDLQSFEVQSFEAHDFSAKRESFPPEIAEYARAAIQSDDRLRYGSPGEGVLHFYCDSPFCGRVKAEVTVGPDGPVVWKTSRTFRQIVTLTDPDPRKYVKTVISQLGQDYSKAMKAVPMKIQIKED